MLKILHHFAKQAIHHWVFNTGRSRQSTHLVEPVPVVDAPGAEEANSDANDPDNFSSNHDFVVDTFFQHVVVMHEYHECFEQLGVKHGPKKDFKEGHPVKHVVCLLNDFFKLVASNRLELSHF